MTHGLSVGHWKLVVWLRMTSDPARPYNFRLSLSGCFTPYHQANAQPTMCDYGIVLEVYMVGSSRRYNKSTLSVSNTVWLGGLPHGIHSI